MLTLKPHKLAEIIRNGVINNPEYRFTHLTNADISWEGLNGVHDCNIWFPTKRGYSYNDPRHISNNGEGHPDDKKSFFLWQDYSKDDNDYLDPEYIVSHYELFIFDGSTYYWDGTVPKYGDILDDWEDGMFVGGRSVPIACLPPDEETAIDRDRRLTYYRSTLCVWGLRNCHCSDGGPCYKEETERYNNGGHCICGFGYDGSDTDSSYDSN